jgi:tetratricopeptide (TPR) repeat protein
MGVCLYLLGRSKEAIQALDKALALDSSLNWVNQAKGLVLESLGQTEEAQKAHDQALRDLSDPKAYLARGRDYVGLRAYDRAIQDFKKALELSPDLPDAYNELAWLYVDRLNDNLEEATELAQKGVQLAKQKGDELLEGQILDTLGWIYYKRGMVETALPLLEEAAHRHPEQLEVLDRLEACRSSRPISLATTG